VPTLLALSEEGHEVVAVVTQPDRPAGRGRQMRASDVKAAATEEGIPVLDPEIPRGEEFLRQIRALEADVSVVVAYGHILRRDVLDVPRHGSINVHASLLPELRGAAPIQWAIARGHTHTGVTVMRMVEAMDAGPILLQEEEPIGEQETGADLTARLSELGAEALVEALALLTVGQLEERPQDDARVTYAPKLDRASARVQWQSSSAEIANLIRGMDDVPGAWSELGGEPMKLFRPMRHEAAHHDVPPGTILRAGGGGALLVATANGAVRIAEVQPPGKKRMSADAWAAGRSDLAGQRFE
jgi:methionyl-tRNA formyltransferase